VEEKVIISREFEFDAAHRLDWHEGKCNNLHGHTYKLIVSISGTPGENGIVMDFGDLKKIVEKLIIETHDHKYLNNLYKNPTAELMAMVIYKKISELLPIDVKLESVKLFESPVTWAEYRGVD